MKSGIRVARYSEFHVLSEGSDDIVTVEWNGESGDDAIITLRAASDYELSTQELRRVAHMLIDISGQIQGEMSDEANP